MSIERAQTYFKTFGIEDRILEFDVSSATVELAAQALSCEPAHIAKSLSFKIEDRTLLILVAGVIAYVQVKQYITHVGNTAANDHGIHTTDEEVIAALVEPLEYKESEKIQELAIIVDTSE